MALRLQHEATAVAARDLQEKSILLPLVNILLQDGPNPAVTDVLPRDDAECMEMLSGRSRDAGRFATIVDGVCREARFVDDG